MIIKNTNTNIKIGIFLKEIRLQENISQQLLVQDTNINVSTYSRMEAGSSSINLENLITILNKLNISINELLHFIELNSNDKDSISNKTNELVAQKNESATLLHIQELQEKYEETKDRFYFYQIFYLRLQQNCLSKTDIDDLYNYLSQKTIYLLQDYALLSNATGVLEYNKLMNICNKMLISLTDLPAEVQSNKKIDSLLINIINRTIINFEEKDTIFYLEFSKQHNKNYPNFFTEVQLTYLTQLSKFRYNTSIEALNECLFFFEMFKRIGYHEFSKSIEKEIDIYFHHPFRPVEINLFSLEHTPHT